MRKKSSEKTGRGGSLALVNSSEVGGVYVEEDRSGARKVA